MLGGDQLLCCERSDSIKEHDIIIRVHESAVKVKSILKFITKRSNCLRHFLAQVFGNLALRLLDTTECKKAIRSKPSGDIGEMIQARDGSDPSRAEHNRSVIQIRLALIRAQCGWITDDAPLKRVDGLLNTGHTLRKRERERALGGRAVVN